MNEQYLIKDETVFEILKQEYCRVMGNVEDINTAFLSKASFYILGIFVAFNLIVETDHEIFEALALIFPFLLLYYFYNTLKYTLKVLEFRGYALALEIRMNNIIGKNLFVENISSTNLYPMFFRNGIYAKGLYGGIIQIVFIIPVSVFVGLYFLKAYSETNISYEMKILILFLLGLGVLSIVFLVYLCASMIKRTKQKTEAFWREDL